MADTHPPYDDRDENRLRRKVHGLDQPRAMPAFAEHEAEAFRQQRPSLCSTAVAASPAASGHALRSTDAARRWGSFGDEALRGRCLDARYMGAMAGTLALAAPHPGSIRGDLRTKPIPAGDGTHRVAAARGRARQEDSAYFARARRGGASRNRLMLRFAAVALLGCSRPASPAPSAPPLAPVSVTQERPLRGPEAPAPSEGLPDFLEALPTRWEALGEGVTWRSATVDFPEARAAARAASQLRWVVIRVDLGRAALRVEPLADARFDGLARDGTVRAALNAGFFEPDLRPSGALVSDGQMLFPPTPRGGTGMVAVAAGRARLVPIARDAGADAVPAASLVVQCTPRLVEADGRVGIYRDDGRRAARSALCLREQGRTLDLIATWDPAAPGEGPGLLQFAQRLAGPSPVGDQTGCEAALNLDGGPSTAVLVRRDGGAVRLHPPRGPVPWALVLRAR